MMIVLSKSTSIHLPEKVIFPFEMIRFRYLSANYCPYEIPFRLLKFFPFHMIRKMTVLSIVNRGRKIPCRHIEQTVMLHFEENIIRHFKETDGIISKR